MVKTVWLGKKSPESTRQWEEESWSEKPRVGVSDPGPSLALHHKSHKHAKPLLCL